MALRLIPTVEEDPDAARVAWGHVLDGIIAAARVPGLSEEDHARLLRMRAKTARLAGRSAVAVEGGDA
jgi:hypothetical protein